MAGGVLGVGDIFGAEFGGDTLVQVAAVGGLGRGGSDCEFVSEAGVAYELFQHELGHRRTAGIAAADEQNFHIGTSKNFSAGIIPRIEKFIQRAIICANRTGTGGIGVGDFEYGIVIERYTGAETVVHIPAEIGGVAVTKIADGAFEWRDDITEIHIPDTVNEIGDEAFQFCDRLSRIHIPNSVLKIGEYAFGTCWSLKELRIPDSVVEIGEAAFYYCEHLEKIYISKGIDQIGDWAFYGCWSLTEVHMPKPAFTQEKNIFRHCGELERVYIDAANWSDEDIRRIFGDERGFEILPEN